MVRCSRKTKELAIIAIQAGNSKRLRCGDRCGNENEGSGTKVIGKGPIDSVGWASLVSS